MKTLFYLICAGFLLSSCARTYHAIRPAIWNYENSVVLADSVSISYMYDMQNAVKNKPYARKERRKNVKLIAVRITNNSNIPVLIKKDNVLVKTDLGREIKILETKDYTNKTRQYPEAFLLFYGMVGIGRTPEIGADKRYYTFYPIPLAIGGGNAIYACISNIRHKREIMENQLFEKTILPGSELYGLLAIQEENYPELTFFYYKE